MNNEMTVAVIVPVYNGMYTIERAIASVQNKLIQSGIYM